MVWSSKCKGITERSLYLVYIIEPTVRSQKWTRCINIFDRTPRNGLKIILLSSFSPFFFPELKAVLAESLVRLLKCESCFQAQKPSREQISCFSCKSRVCLNWTGACSTSCVEAIPSQYCAHRVTWSIQTVTSFPVSSLVMPGTTRGYLRSANEAKFLTDV